MQKIILLFYFFQLILINSTNANQFPSDSTLLKTIFGNVDKEGKSSSKTGYSEFTIDGNDTLKFEIVFKDFGLINEIETVVVVCQAKCFSLHGHSFGFTNYYFLRKNGTAYKVINTEEEKEPAPIGDEPNMELVRIGKRKSALLKFFVSTGNQHLERSVSILFLSSTGLQNILNFDLEYSNEAWVDPEETPSNEECGIFSFSCTFKILESEKEWFDIIVNKKNRSYSVGCKELISNEEKTLYQFNENKYSEVK